MLYEPDEREIISSLFPNKTDLILFDVGAHDFGTGLQFKHWFPTAKVFAFEPDRENTKQYIDNARRFGIEAFPYAIGDKNDIVTFYPSLSIEGRRHKQAGSVNKPILKDGTDDEQIEFDRCVFDMNGYNVILKRLDTFCNENGVAHIDYLHMDVQSYEKNVINGLGDINTMFVLAETANFHQYNSEVKNENDFHEFMFLKKYEILQKFKYDTLYKKHE